MSQFDGPGPEAAFHAHLAEGRFMIQRSASTGRHVFYPRVMEPCSGTADLEWVEASGLGTVYATTANRSRDGAYNIALVDLDEGPRMMARVEGIDAGDVTIGMRVRASVGEIDGTPAVIFHPEGA